MTNTDIEANNKEIIIVDVEHLDHLLSGVPEELRTAYWPPVKNPDQIVFRDPRMQMLQMLSYTRTKECFMTRKIPSNEDLRKDLRGAMALVVHLPELQALIDEGVFDKERDYFDELSDDFPTLLMDDDMCGAVFVVGYDIAAMQRCKQKYIKEVVWGWGV